MSFDLTNKNISDTFQNLLQSTGSDGRLYDLTGNEIGNLRISGSLTAQQYIVSSSVTNISIATLSGSTSFGDSVDDTHSFTGTGSFDILGIGGAAKTTPLAKLHVRDSVNPQLRLDSATIATRYATFQVDEDNNAFVIDGTYGKMQFKNSTTTT